MSLINYIYKFGSDSNRANKLMRKKERMEKNVVAEWPAFRDQLKVKVCGLQKRFNELWRSYCRKIYPIWKKR